MKFPSILFLLFSFTLSAQTIRVARIVDGDTFKDSTEQGYRLIGINAPESHDISGPEATQFLDSLINHKNIQIVTDSKYDTIDFYKRKLCYAYLNGIDINKLMIQTGHAIAFTKYRFAKTQEYLTAQKEFMSKSQVVQQATTTNILDKDNFLTGKNIKIFILLILVIALTTIAIYYYRK
jgi:micrococcal nuclease